MKRILVLFCTALLLTACHNASQDPVIKGYRIQQVGDLGLSANLITGGAFKLKLFAEFEAFKIQKNSPFWASFLLGYSAGFYF